MVGRQQRMEPRPVKPRWHLTPLISRCRFPIVVPSGILVPTPLEPSDRAECRAIHEPCAGSRPETSGKPSPSPCMLQIDRHFVVHSPILQHHRAQKQMTASLVEWYACLSPFERFPPTLRLM